MNFQIFGASRRRPTVENHGGTLEFSADNLRMTCTEIKYNNTKTKARTRKEAKHACSSNGAIGDVSVNSDVSGPAIGNGFSEPMSWKDASNLVLASNTFATISLLWQSTMPLVADFSAVSTALALAGVATDDSAAIPEVDHKQK